MKTKSNFKPSLFLALLSCLNIFACGNFEEWWYNSDYLFPKELIKDTSYILYYKNGLNYESNFEKLPDAIVSEWKSRFQKASEKDIKYAIFNLTVDQVSSLKSGSNPIPSNGFFAELTLPENKAYLEYLNFVVRENNAVNPSEYSWEDPNIDTVQIQLLKDDVEGMFKKEMNDPFLRQKYTYLLVKLYHMNKMYDNAISAFDAYAESGPKNLSYYRALGYKAGSLRFTGDTIQSKLLFAKIFDLCPPLRLMAYKNFKYVEYNVNLLLPKAANNMEKSSLWMMQYIYDDQRNFLALKEIYQNDPNSGKFEVICLKEMNLIHYEYMDQIRKSYNVDTTKLIKVGTIDQCNSQFKTATVILPEKKNWFSRLWEAIINFFKRLFGKTKADEATNGTELDQNKDIGKIPFYIEDEWLTEYIDFFELVVKERKCSNFELNESILAYLYLITGKFEEAQDIIEKHKTSKVTAIKELNDFLDVWNLLVAHEKIDPNFESTLIAYYKKYSSKEIDSNHSKLKDLKMEYFRRLLMEKQFEKALALLDDYAQEDYLHSYCNCEVLDKIIQYYETKPNDKIFSIIKPIEIANLRNVKIQRLLQMGKFEDAFALAPEYEFTKYIKDGEIETIGTLEELVQYLKNGDPESLGKVADIIANADDWRYNVYPWGNWKGYYPIFANWESYTTSKYPYNAPGLGEDYLNGAKYEANRVNSVKLAITYYNLAISKSSDREFKAKMYFNAQYALNKSFHDADSVYRYYPVLKNEYSNTKFYKEAYNSCAFLRKGKVIPYSNYY